MPTDKFEALFNSRTIAGLSVAVTDKRGIIYKNAFGYENIERECLKSSPESLYRIASVTKVVLGVLTMRLAEMGLVSLDAPITNYFPHPKLEKITLRHLLSHTSGLPSEYTPVGERDEYYLEESILKELESVTPLSSPEEKIFLYSNLGIRIASLVLEKQTGRKFSSLAEEYVLAPLSMDRTTFKLSVAATYPLSLPHSAKDGALKVERLIKENDVRLAAGGLYSSVIDLCALARLFLNDGFSDRGEKILSRESIDEMLTPHAEKNESEYYGLTTFIRKSSPTFGHLGDNSPYMASFWFNRERGIGIAALFNTEDKALRYDIPKIVFGEF